MQQHTLEHLHKRKVASGERPLVNTPFTRFLDVLIIPVGVANVFMGLPQAYEVWVNQNVAGVSLLTFSMWMLFAVVWIVYGYVHRDRPIFYMHIGWLLLHGSIVLGILAHS